MRGKEQLAMTSGGPMLYHVLVRVLALFSESRAADKG